VTSERDEWEGSRLSCSSRLYFRVIPSESAAVSRDRAPTRRALWQGLAATVALAGCARGPDPTPIGVTLKADAGINPNDEGKSSPVVVRLYELKGLKAFNNATFFDIMDDETKALGAELIGSREYEMTPGQEQKYDRDVSAEATHLGVVAAFRNIQSAKWRDSIELEQEKQNDFVIFLTSQSVRIEKLRGRILGIF
jgi:type VI secretion system protein VasD